MTLSRIEVALWSTAIALAAIAMLGARPPHGGGGVVSNAERVRLRPSVANNGDVNHAAISLVETDPFRVSRHPSPIGYRSDLEGALPTPPRVSRPLLAISGIIGGPPWSAVLEGVPGREAGAVVHPGDTLGGLKIHAVKRDTVVITGMDTTWRLIVRRAW
jgi:hypothetical protein